MKLTGEKINSLVGQRIGNLVVDEYFGKDGDGHWYLCLCDCGNETIVRRNHLLSEHTRSCGCLKLKTAIANGKKARSVKLIHGHMIGHKPTITYKAWSNMKSKCRNPRSIQWHTFGGKGITFHEQWEDFRNFIGDMGERPSGTFMRRIDKLGNFTPDNCEWSSTPGYNNGA